MSQLSVCGVDEAGRGPIAGPVSAGAVILPADFPVDILDDSKKMTPANREKAAVIIREKAIDWGLGWAWHYEIDELNIHHATLLAMARAIRSLRIKPEMVLVDGIFTPDIAYPCKAVKKGDSLVHEIMAASIIAKTFRDCLMECYDMIEPVYRFGKHKGYPTVLHRKLVGEHGMSDIHRRSFTIIVP